MKKNDEKNAVIPGLTRKPVVNYLIPACAGMTGDLRVPS